jgi:hypothetical protein
MDEIRHFVPGEDEGGQTLAVDFLARLRWPIPAGVAQAYVEAYTQPGERVLVPFCQGPQAVRELLAAGRVAVAINFDPLLVLLAQVALDAPPARELDAAVARLGDSLKQGMPLRQYLGDLYATTCPACLRQAVATYFVWDREQAEPVAKYVRCPACDYDGRTAVDLEDRERLAGIDPRGIHYHYVLDRIAAGGSQGPPKARLEQWLELYSARNLYALAELTLKIESLFSPGKLQRALKLLLLDCLDRCSSLALPPGRTRPSRQRQRLARPSRYLEYNAWLAFEEAVTRLFSLAAETHPGLAPRLEALQATGDAPPAGAEPAGGAPGVVAQGLVRDLPRHLPARSLRLILTGPPPLDPAAWSLSYLWGAWLLGAEAVAPLQSLLRQRGADPAWYARVMAGSLATLSDLLRDDGRLVMLVTGQPPAVLEALVLAATTANLGVAALLQRGGDYRLEMAPAAAPTVGPSGPPLKERLRQAALEAATATIRARGEPASWPVLHAAIQRRLVEQGLLQRVVDASVDARAALDLVASQVGSALEDPSLVCLTAPEETPAVVEGAPAPPVVPVAAGEERYWLAAPTGMDVPLSDRVEAQAHQILQDRWEGGQGEPLTQDHFARALYTRFPGPLTPDRGLVAACLETYGQTVAEGRWRLRPEDLPGVRDAEREEIIDQLLTLGRRLGYGSHHWDPFDAAWLEGEAVRALFIVRWRAAVSDLLALEPQPAGGSSGPRVYLVIPGGRAALVSYKLGHNPLWQRAVEGKGWRFIKYRHVRQLAAQDEVDEYQLRTIVGLDPIVEREGAQIPLF